jgi:hypothetical protein
LNERTQHWPTVIINLDVHVCPNLHEIPVGPVVQEQIEASVDHAASQEDQTSDQLTFLRLGQTDGSWRKNSCYKGKKVILIM